MRHPTRPVPPLQLLPQLLDRAAAAAAAAADRKRTRTTSRSRTEATETLSYETVCHERKATQSGRPHRLSTGGWSARHSSCRSTSTSTTSCSSCSPAASPTSWCATCRPTPACPASQPLRPPPREGARSTDRRQRKRADSLSLTRVAPLGIRPLVADRCRRPLPSSRSGRSRSSCGGTCSSRR